VDQWLDPATSILLLDWRAALVVQELAKNAKEPDASVFQRVSKAVSEAFAGRQVGEMLSELKAKFGETSKESVVVGRLFLLVCSRLSLLCSITILTRQL
jgi:acyl-CoA oxidase